MRRVRFRTVNEPRKPANVAGIALWTTLGVAFVAWALLVWHPWIDWFGRT